MKRFMIGMMAASFVLSALAGPVMAATAKTKAHAKMAAGMKCPYCGMWMPTHKTAKMTMPIKVKGATYYCCTTCHPSKAKASAKHAVKMSSPKKTM